MTSQVMRFAPQRAEEEEAGPAEWRYVSFDVVTPSDYWDTGQDALPKAVTERTTRLSDYEDLFHGELSTWLPTEERTVSKNWCGDIAQVYVDFLMASPPVWYVGEQPLLGSGLIPDSTLHSFEMVTEEVVRDQVIYGTALAEVVEGEVRRVHPKLWYPTGGDDDVVAGPLPGDEGVLVVKRFEPLGVVRREYFAVDENGQLSVYTGPQPDMRTETGTPEAWAVVDELTDGRLVTLTPCPREPVEGDWGWRLYEDLAKLAFEYVRRMSLRSRSIGRHEDPILVGIPNENEGAAIAPKVGVDRTDQEQIRLRQLSDDLTRWREQQVAWLPSGLQGLEYTSFEGDYGASGEALQEVRKDIISTARLPASLLGIDDIRLGSGVALRVSHSQTYLAMQQLQESLIRYLRRIMIILALDMGTDAGTLRAFAEELRAEWMNPVDFLEEGESMLTEEGGDQEEVDDDEDDDTDDRDAALLAAALRMSGGRDAAEEE